MAEEGRGENEVVQPVNLAANAAANAAANPPTNTTANAAGNDATIQQMLLAPNKMLLLMQDKTLELNLQ
jgi:TRAP-type uncharacterized transport system fused permease subunit